MANKCKQCHQQNAETDEQDCINNFLHVKYNNFGFGTHSETSWYFISKIVLFSIMYEKSGRIIHLIFP